MTPFGFSRSSIRSDHALITPESHVRSALPCWQQTEVIILISPEMGMGQRAQFSQYLAVMAKGGVGTAASASLERAVFVIEGKVEVRVNSEKQSLTAGGYAFLPAGTSFEISATEASRLNVFEKCYVPLKGQPAPHAVLGNEKDIAGAAFMGDEGAVLKTLLPTDLPFDMAMNVFTFSPGAALPLVEVHMMEHGLLMLQGGGIYRLANEWYPVQEGDVIWMAPYCPQWFGALGKTESRYLYYKDMNRHVLPESSQGNQ